jgi:serine/threonine protein kinase
MVPRSWPGKDGVFGRYRIEKVVGEGGMGAVYLAHDTVLDRAVALKIPRFSGDPAAAAARFLREAQAAAGLSHPNICPIFDVGQLDGTHYLCMCFLTGRTLAELVAPDQPMGPTEAARMVRSIALAMQYAHSKGVIHRDLKPVNVMVDDRGEPVIMDFGLARRKSGSQLTVEGAMMGTPAYMPPEQVSGEVAKMGPACDIYSLGIVLYELLTGTTPFTGELFALVTQIALDPPQPPSARRPGLNPRFDSVVLKAIAKKPEDRWSSMQLFADALAGLAGATAAPAVGVAAFDGPALTLKVDGTAFAYRPPPGVSVVTVGRQRRRPGDPPDQGNDFVLRVAGNDGLSARISRRHFEIHRTPAGFAVVDKSKAGVTRNGAPLPKDTPVPLSDGDRLGVAGVVTLEVLIQGAGAAPPSIRQAALVEVPAPLGAGGGRVEIEASLGDMVTMG